MKRPDLREIAGNIREALDDCDRDALLDMLTFVFKEYVVEGPPPLLVSQSERIEDLEGLSFAELIRALQTRLDVPELAMFQVDNNQVSVRVNGVLTPLQATPSAPERTPPVTQVQVVENRMPQPPARPPGAPAAAAAPAAPSSSVRPNSAAAAAAQPAAAPRPTGGLSVRGRPAAQSPSPQQGGGAAAQRPAAAPASPPPAREPAPEPKPPEDTDAAAERFSLLELD